jgi:hypothetical protein
VGNASIREGGIEVIAIYFVEFLNRHAEGLGLLILAGVIALAVIGVAFAVASAMRGRDE